MRFMRVYVTWLEKKSSERYRILVNGDQSEGIASSCIDRVIQAGLLNKSVILTFFWRIN